MTDRKPIFDAIRAALGRGFTGSEVADVDSFLDRLGIPRRGGADPIAATAVAHLAAEEGRRARAYKDHLGYWTIGVGRLLDKNKDGRVTVDGDKGGITPREESILLANDPTRRAGDWLGLVLSDSEMDMLLANDIEAVRLALETRATLAPAWRAVKDNPYRATALISMAFQMGADGLAKFTTTLGHVAAGRFAEAAASARQSRWADQTPNRAARVTRMLETGRPA